MDIKAFFDKDTFTLTYVVYDSKTKDAVIIDPVLDYDPNASIITKHSIEEVVGFVKNTGLNPLFVVDTHAHADHLSGSHAIKEFFPDIRVAIGEKITEVQKVFKGVYNLSDNFKVDGSQFDLLLKIGETCKVGSLSFKILPTPGHTPACSAYLFNDKAVFTGDALFMPDYGTGRCDFPSGSAADLYDSVTKQLYTLSDNTHVFVGHDYQPGGRELKYESTIGEEKAHNIRLNRHTTREEFIKAREDRDAQLTAPRLLLPSIQVNIRAGRLPEAEANGVHYFKIPTEMG